MSALPKYLQKTLCNCVLSVDLVLLPSSRFSDDIFQIVFDLLGSLRYICSVDTMYCSYIYSRYRERNQMAKKAFEILLAPMEGFDYQGFFLLPCVYAPLHVLAMDNCPFHLLYSPLPSFSFFSSFSSSIPSY